MQFIDTHCHLDGEEFRDDLDAVVTRAREAGVAAIGVPGINLESLDTVLELLWYSSREAAAGSVMGRTSLQVNRDRWLVYVNR